MKPRCKAGAISAANDPCGLSGGCTERPLTPCCDACSPPSLRHHPDRNFAIRLQNFPPRRAWESLTPTLRASSGARPGVVARWSWAGRVRAPCYARPTPNPLRRPARRSCCTPAPFKSLRSHLCIADMVLSLLEGLHLEQSKAASLARPGCSDQEIGPARGAHVASMCLRPRAAGCNQDSQIPAAGPMLLRRH